MTTSPSERLAHLRKDPAYAGLARSLDIYYGHAARDAAMDALYAQFIGAGEVAMDIGSHVGDRIGAFRRIGAKVIALEPQPDCAGVIRELYGGDPGVTLIEAACGAEPGRLTLRINSANPTVTTASDAFIAAAAGAGGWEGQVWDRVMDVEVTTLDALIQRFGAPRFVKIDVEGFEADVLQGLSVPVAALSFEFTTIQRDVALRCLDRLRSLGSYRFDVALGESQQLVLDDWVTADRMREVILGLPHEANSGDVYAKLV